MRAFCHKAAAPAGYKTGKSPPVNKQHTLLSPAQTILDPGMEAPGQHGLVSGAELLSHIHCLHTGKASSRQPLPKMEQPDLTMLRSPVGLQRRCRRPQDQHGAVHSGYFLCHIPCLIFGHGFIFVTALVFLIDHDHPRMGKGGKQGAAGADDNIDLPPSGTFPLICPLCFGKGGIYNADPVPEMAVKAHQCLKCQGYFRDQHDRLSSTGTDLTDDGDIDLCFPAAGDPVDQADRQKSITAGSAAGVLPAGLQSVKIRDHCIHDLLLSSTQFHTCPRAWRYIDGISKFLHGKDFQDPRPFHRIHCIRGDVQPGRNERIRKLGNLQEFLQQSRPRSLVLFLIDLQLFFTFLSGKQQPDLPVFPGLPRFPGSEHRPHCSRHSGAVAVLHPCGKAQVELAVILHRITACRFHDLRDLFDLVFFHFRPVRKTDHISFAERISGPEGHHDDAPRPNALLQSVRDPVAERPVQSSAGNIDDHLCIFFQAKTLHFPHCTHAGALQFADISCRISLIRTRSSMGCFSPLIS